MAEDIGKKGNSSELYAKAKAAMDAGTTWSIQLTNGRTITYKIIGIAHDDLADGTGKAGLTFLTTSYRFGRWQMNAAATNVGGWEASELRAKMNSGEIWNMLPADLQLKIENVTKLTNNVGGGKANKNAAVTATTDKLFLLSYSEIVPTSYWASDYPWTSNEGTQYEAFKGKVMNNNSVNAAIAVGGYNHWWERTVQMTATQYFLFVNDAGKPSCNGTATNTYNIFPAFCF